MKITFLIANADLSGGARVVSIYARALIDRGHEVKVVVARGPRVNLRDRIKRLVKGGQPHVRQPSHFDTMEQIVLRIDRLGPIKATDCPDADVIIATWWETAEWMDGMPERKGRKVHFVQGFEAFDYTPKDRVYAVLRSHHRKITISEWLERLLKEKFHSDDVHLVLNGVDMRQFNAPPRKRASVPTVGMLYHEMPGKNSSDAISAYLGLKAKLPDAKLIAFGTGAPSSAVPLPDGATYFRSPAQDKIKDIYSACDVWVCPSSREGFHLPPLEAMACRCPVISTPVGGPLDIIREAQNGFIVPHGDVTGMTKKLIDFFELDDEDWSRMSDEAYHTAVSHDWNDAVDKFEEALHFR